MPYQHCSSCRLTVHVADDVPEGGHCPRCGGTLLGEPRSLFPHAPVRARRFARTPSALTPEAVRNLMSARRARFSRERPEAHRSG